MQQDFIYKLLGQTIKWVLLWVWITWPQLNPDFVICLWGTIKILQKTWFLLIADDGSSWSAFLVSKEASLCEEFLDKESSLEILDMPYQETCK